MTEQEVREHLVYTAVGGDSSVRVAHHHAARGKLVAVRSLSAAREYAGPLSPNLQIVATGVAMGVETRN